MAVVRAAQNPILRPQDIRASRDDFEVIGVFNAGVARYRDEVILLLRVAERPLAERDDIVLSPIYDVDTGAIALKAFAREDPRYDFSDPRLIVAWEPRPRRQPHPAGPPTPEVPVDTVSARRGARAGPPARETYLTSISHLRLARSKDGLRFQVADEPALGPANKYETFGVEDPRITALPPTPRGAGARPSSWPSVAEGVGPYCITYVGVSPLGVTTCLASTRDFQSFERHGVLFPPDNKDVVLFPAPLGGRYYALHRPHSSLFLRNDIWLAASTDLLGWGEHRHLLGTRAGKWDELRIGAGAVPFRTREGWLELYHGADRHHRYCLGAVLLDGEEPRKVLARSDRPVFEPQAQYERAGFFGDVVFSCGLLFEDETLKVYYGAADTSICYAEIPLADVYANLGL